MDATACLENAARLKMSHLAIFWLRAKKDLLDLSRFGRALQREFPDGIHKLVRKELMTVAPVCSESFVVSYTKKDALEKFEAMLQKSGEQDAPVMPFMFQTANGSSFSGSLFFVFKSAEDALHRIRRIAVERCFCANGIVSPQVLSLLKLFFALLICDFFKDYADIRTSTWRLRAPHLPHRGLRNVLAPLYKALHERR